MNSFEDVSIENIAHCGSLDYSGGLRARLYYAPAIFFKRIDLPAETNDFQQKLLLSSYFIDFQNENCGWGFLDILIDENELKPNLDGGIQRKKTKTGLDVFVLGFSPKILGCLEIIKNLPMVFCISTANNYSLLIGNLRNRAFITKADITTGRKYEDNIGATINIGCNSPIYFFDENIVIEPIDSEPGTIIKDGGGFIDITQDY